MGVYVYSGKDLYRLEEGIKDKIRRLGIDRDHIVQIDADKRSEFKIERVLMECDTFSLFDSSSSKAVIVKNPYFLNGSSAEKTGKSKKQKDNDFMNPLEKYLRQPNPTTELFFYCHGYDADSRRKEYKLLTKYDAVIVSFKNMNEREFSAYAADTLKKNGIVLTQPGMNELLDRCSLDTLKLHQAVENLLIYGDKKPDLETIQHVVAQNDEVDVFRLSNMFTAGNLDGTMRAYQRMRMNNEPVNRMILLLAGSLRRLYNMKVLYEEGMDEESIAVRLHQKNKWAVHYGLQNGAYLSSRTVLRLLKELADLDQAVKAGNVDAEDGFEDFLIRNGRRNAGNQRTL